ncbi:helix-turn-helix domain protein [Andreesenia angusta]|uniref:Helix-turn-helix domain protein n=1 Tax=Andreesenia angusta TaxID=39480 RepID=A0A1S1V8Y6_9FIRM|nr:helix-turn-helix transcriptional regulator [Andreesenia angusta]OHW62199.1 helix-turn-helix domain protein [Andreesenia angusta]
MEPLYKKLREYRISKGITQTHISRMTGISNAKLSSIENGNTELKADDFILIAVKGFGVNPSFFTDGVLETKKKQLLKEA